ncbi:hypothetical protein I203_102085 [Kwoniella mangroviensis CBS 8507]|uniref:uncharacterized protein n=1 Tax=Kwoniella mangroviensis CBS 8507 TaxID=1296122 RepID=UPI00080CD9FB|nr:uncharacterized protein I203_03280 [Kwoniella mangroviensis CBS 8507]OCF67583.1 hypothetical protein I203_03280 [Kwoniella mangroviensis CBS 8507]
MSADKHPESIPALMSSLRHLRDTNPKAVRANVHIYPATLYANNGESSSTGSMRDRKIISWKMTEHMYFNSQNPFPTLARGLFTEEIQENDPLPDEVSSAGEGCTRPEDRIVARGYDKFFNIDEVEWTNWSAMKLHTEPPYHLTLKSNGCLILISALSPSHLIVASKHSLGTTTEAQEQEAAHAAVGREWVKKTLTAKGKTEAELAKKLWDGNMTAVLELCDDSFEEHVIATPAHWTGLHLHGLNHNTPHFSTSPPDQVNSFAEEFGFIQTKYVELQTLDEVKWFTDDVAKTGSWEGDMIEGFVVRCKVKQPSQGSQTNGKPPYKVGSPFFFKVKFDEPYLLYRQWREITRVMLPLLEKTEPEDIAAIWKKVRTKSKRPEVSVYADWVGKMIKTEPALFDNYEKGVVRVRERFLRWIEEDESAKKLWNDARDGKAKNILGKNGSEQQQRSKEGLPKKWLLVPIAVPGCGKTLIGVALSKLFGFGHTQSDDITTKRTAPTFIKNITALLQKEDVVYADRNNHIPKHYEELSAIASSKPMQKYDVRLIGIVWDISSQPYHRLLRICSERVVARGDNHQTLRPDPTVDAEHEAVVGQFLRNFTSPDPLLFDQLIDVKALNSPREVLGEIVNSLVNIMGLPKPQEGNMNKALDEAGEYKVTTPYHAPAKVGKPIRYFGIAPEIDLGEIVENIIQYSTSFGDKNECLESVKEVFDLIKSQGRITSKPHITLSHEKNVATEAEQLAPEGKEGEEGPQKKLWETCRRLSEMKVSMLFKFRLTHLIWDKRVMTLAIEDFRPIPVDKEGGVQVDLESVLPSDVKSLLHITVGTVSEEISAFESRGLMKVLRDNGDSESGEKDEVVEDGGKVRWIRVKEMQGEGRVKGMS